MRLNRPLFEFEGRALSGKDLILITGGLFLMFKGTHEIHEKLEEDGLDTPQSDLGDAKSIAGAAVPNRFGAVLVQIALLDIVFSLDSVITAVGMAKSIMVMSIAVVLAVVFMMFASHSISRFINRHPTVKMLALSFLLLIGTALVADGLHFHIPKGYIYFAMAFSVGVEMLNIGTGRGRKARKS
jgi:predicted tellurium resistance membrane protein TerC